VRHIPFTPANDITQNALSGFRVEPRLANAMAGKGKQISAVVIFAQHFDIETLRRLQISSEFGKSFGPRRH
jgi:hypothetical protein